MPHESGQHHSEAAGSEVAMYILKAQNEEAHF